MRGLFHAGLIFCFAVWVFSSSSLAGEAIEAVTQFKVGMLYPSKQFFSIK